ncbi:MAG: hypothetical protein ACREVJ_01165 [Gammaproteobacteria bacterium]
MEHYGYAVPRIGPASVGLAHQSARRRPIKIITNEEVEMVIGSDVLQVKQWIREALQAHHEGKFIQPQKSYLFTSDNPYERIISLPAACLGDQRILGVKWIGSHSKNCERGLDRAQAMIILNDPETHAAAVVMEGTLISSMRTLAVSLIVIDQFAPRPRRVGLIGMGKLGRMHARVLGGLYTSIERISCFSARARFDDLLDDALIKKCATPQEVVADSEVIVTVGAPTRPYLGESDLGPHVRLIVNLSLLDFELPVIVNSNHIVVDDWLQNMRAEKVFKTGVDQGLITRDRVIELADVLFGPRRVYEGRVFVNLIALRALGDRGRCPVREPGRARPALRPLAADATLQRRAGWHSTLCQTRPLAYPLVRAERRERVRSGVAERAVDALCHCREPPARPAAACTRARSACRGAPRG